MMLGDLKYKKVMGLWAVLYQHNTPLWVMVFKTKGQAAMAYWVWEYCKGWEE